MNQEVLSRYWKRLDSMMQHFIRLMHQELVGTLEEGITGQQFTVMKIIHDRNRVTVTELADTLYVSLSAVTALVDRLCRAKMVVRRRSQEDRRVVWLELTDKGQETVAICLEGRQRVLERYLGQLTEQEILQLISIYEKILALLQEDERVNYIK